VRKPEQHNILSGNLEFDPGNQFTTTNLMGIGGEFEERAGG
jgi:hypothetical protein